MDLENIFICIAAPLLAAAFCMRKKNLQFFLFMIAGMGACLLSAYVNAFFGAVYHADSMNIAADISPVVEEVMKFFPLFFYLLVFEPRPEKIRTAIITVAAGFATFENVCYLTEYGSEHFFHLLIRGFGTGAMHIVCGVIMGSGLVYVWKRAWLKIAGTCGLLGVAVSFHGIYNLLITFGGTAQYIAYVLPFLILLAGTLSANWAGHFQGDAKTASLRTENDEEKFRT